MSEATIHIQTASTVSCFHCGAETSDEHFCPECGRIQAITAGTDYFSFFGLPKKLRIDDAELEKSFYQLSRRVHPDYFMSASEGERQTSTELSSMLNDAYRTLRDKVARVHYLLSLEGYKEAEKRAPADLLEEVFELNMQVEEMKAAKKIGDEEEVAEARSSLEESLAGLRNKLGRIDDRLFALFENWDSVVDQGAEAGAKKRVLDQMSELLSHRSYIRNLVRDIKEELNPDAGH